MTKRNAVRFGIAALCAVLTASLLYSCGKPTDWYPAGTVIVTDFYEVTDATSKSIVVTCTLENTGSSAISRGTFTVAAKTGTRTYYKTVSSELRILPGAKIKIGTVLGYENIAEVLQISGLTVSDSFFE